MRQTDKAVRPEEKGGGRRAVNCSSAVHGSSSRCTPRDRSWTFDCTMESRFGVDGLKGSRLLQQLCVRQLMIDYSLLRGRSFQQSVSTGWSSPCMRTRTLLFISKIQSYFFYFELEFDKQYDTSTNISEIFTLLFPQLFILVDMNKSSICFI